MDDSQPPHRVQVNVPVAPGNILSQKSLLDFVSDCSTVCCFSNRHQLPASHANHTASKLHDGILPTSIGPSHHSTAGCLYPVSQRFAAIRKCHRRPSFPPQQ